LHLVIRPVAGEAKPVGLEPVPVDIARVMIRYHHAPGVLRDRKTKRGFTLAHDGAGAGIRRYRAVYPAAN
jgi:hypothetical protein